MNRKIYFLIYPLILSTHVLVNSAKAAPHVDLGLSLGSNLSFLNLKEESNSALDANSSLSPTFKFESQIGIDDFLGFGVNYLQSHYNFQSQTSKYNMETGTGVISELSTEVLWFQEFFEVALSFNAQNRPLFKIQSDDDISSSSTSFSSFGIGGNLILGQSSVSQIKMGVQMQNGLQMNNIDSFWALNSLFKIKIKSSETFSFFIEGNYNYETIENGDQVQKLNTVIMLFGLGI